MLSLSNFWVFDLSSSLRAPLSSSPTSTCTPPRRLTTVSRRRVVRPAASATDTLELTSENVENVLDEVRPYLMADGGNVELVEIDGLVVRLQLQGACGSCPSSTTTMRMGIERKLRERIPEILEVEQIEPEQTGLALNAENIETTLDEIRPYLVGTGGGELTLVEITGPVVKVSITGPAADVMTVRVAVSQKRVGVAGRRLESGAVTPTSYPNSSPPSPRAPTWAGFETGVGGGAVASAAAVDLAVPPCWRPRYPLRPCLLPRRPPSRRPNPSFDSLSPSQA